MDIPETDPHKYNQLIFLAKEQSQHNEETIVFKNNAEQLDIHMQK